MDSDDTIFIPSRTDISEENVWRWYQNVMQEWSLNYLTSDEVEYSREYYHDAGLTRSAKRDFFRAHFADSFFQASSFLINKLQDRTILDLGCGTGTQSLYFALLGARVIAADLDDVALRILEKRREFYSKKAGRSLDIQIVYGDSHGIEYSQYGPIHCIYSMFAFNMMQPSNELLRKIMPSLSDDARVAIIDGNNESWLGRFVPSRKRSVWSPTIFAEQLDGLGFTVEEHEGGIVLPPFLWKVLTHRFARRLDVLLRKNWFLPISHQILARRAIR